MSFSWFSSQLAKQNGYRYGLTLSVLGMCIFNIGLTYGLGAIGSQTGGVSSSFLEIPVSESPIFNIITGLSIVIGFAFILGFGATLLNLP